MEASAGLSGKTTRDYGYRLSQQELKEIKEVFDLFDTNFDGTIAVNDLGAAMRGLGLVPSQLDVDRLTREMDSSDPPTSKIDLSTFLVYMAREYRDLAENKQSDIREAFMKSFPNNNPADNKKLVPIVAFRSLLTSSGERLSDEEVDEVIKIGKADHSDIEVDLDKVCNEICKQVRNRKSQKNV